MIAIIVVLIAYCSSVQLLCLAREKLIKIQMFS